MNYFNNFTLNLIIVKLTISSVVNFLCYAVNEVPYSYQYMVDYNGLVCLHWEERIQDLLRGSYSFLQPDGMIRTVHYQVIGNRGFEAIVQYRKIHDDAVIGPLKYPISFKHPIILSKPVNVITLDLFQSTRKYPNLPD